MSIKQLIWAVHIKSARSKRAPSQTANTLWFFSPPLILFLQFDHFYSEYSDISVRFVYKKYQITKKMNMTQNTNISRFLALNLYSWVLSLKKKNQILFYRKMSCKFELRILILRVKFTLACDLWLHGYSGSFCPVELEHSLTPARVFTSYLVQFCILAHRRASTCCHGNRNLCWPAGWPLSLW